MNEIKLQAEATAWLEANEEDLSNVVGHVFAELARAAIKHPVFPLDIIHGAAIVGEESGELLRACLQLVYETGQKKENGFILATRAEVMVAKDEVYTEALHTAATAIRFLINFKL